MITPHWRVHVEPFWVRHPHWSGILTVGLMLFIALMLTGCDEFWRCTWNQRPC